MDHVLSIFLAPGPFVYQKATSVALWLVAIVAHIDSVYAQSASLSGDPASFPRTADHAAINAAS